MPKPKITDTRCAVIASVFVLLSVGLAAAHVWRNISTPEGELFNKGEWSIVQTLQNGPNGVATSESVVTIKNVFGNPDYDAIGIPRLDGRGSVWILSNAAGIPRIKGTSSNALRHICRSEYEQIKSTVRLNSDVDTMLLALTTPDCEK